MDATFRIQDGSGQEIHISTVEPQWRLEVVVWDQERQQEIHIGLSIAEAEAIGETLSAAGRHLRDLADLKRLP